MSGEVDARPGAARIAVIDDHAILREGMRAVLRREEDLELVAEAADAREAAHVTARVPVDLAVIDIALPGGSAIAVTRELRRVQPFSRVLVLSAVDEPYRVAEALRAGAGGWALKTQTVREVVSAIRVVLAGARYLAPGIPGERIEALVEGRAAGPLD